jgi:8-oxo-dGTP diphosphatase
MVKKSEMMDDLSIDCVIFGFHDLELQLLLVKHAGGIGKGKWGLPGGWILEMEDLDDAAYRILKELTGIESIYLEQLRAFGKVDRFPGKRVVTVAYFALVDPGEYHLIPGFTASDVVWYKVNSHPKLLYDHEEIVGYALEYLRRKVRHEPIGFNLLPEEFTLLDLQQLYESLLQQPLDKSNFRRKFRKMGLLQKSDKKQEDVPHRAATLYSFDKSTYQRLVREGFNFEV